MCVFVVPLQKALSDWYSAYIQVFFQVWSHQRVTGMLGIFHSPYTHTHTHTHIIVRAVKFQSRTMISYYLLEDVCDWYFPGNLRDIYIYQTVNTWYVFDFSRATVDISGARYLSTNFQHTAIMQEFWRSQKKGYKAIRQKGYFSIRF